MAAGGLGGALNVRVFNLHSDLSRTKCPDVGTRSEAKFCRLKISHGIRGIQVRQEPVHFAGSVSKWWNSANTSIIACSSSSQTKNQSVDASAEKKSVRTTGLAMPKPLEVESLLINICDTTSIAEFEMNFGGFRLYVKRDLYEENIPPPIPPSPPAHTDTSNQSPLNGSAATTSLAISKPQPSSGGIRRFLDSASDEGLVILQSPKVGFFRRCRTIKGKRAPLSCKEKQEVKEGQVLCYIEQLGGEIPIESDVTGEVIKILRDDGEPVGYGDALIAVLPAFPGIKKLH